jgi:hypothetical protein
MMDTRSIQPKLVEEYSPTPINPATQPTPINPAIQPTTYMPQPLYYQTGAQVQYVQSPNIQPPPGAIYMVPPYQNPEIFGIRDWLPWSITNIFIGWLVAGILPLTFSLICRSYKRSNNVQRAKTMSVLALIFNILVTLGGIGGWIGLIVSLVLAARAVNVVTNCGLAGYNC